MEAAAAAASAAAAAAKDAALASSVAAGAAANYAATAAATAKEAADAAKHAAEAASAAALNAKEAAAAASAAALNAKEAAMTASAAALDAKEAAAVGAAAAQAAAAAAAAMESSRKRRFAAAALNAKEAGPAAATAGQAAEAVIAKEAAPMVAAGRAVEMQASKKPKFAWLYYKVPAPAAAGAIVAKEAAPMVTAGRAVDMQASKKRKSVAAALNYNVPGPVSPTTGEATAASLQVSNKRVFHIIDVDQDSPGSGDIDDAGSVDLISRLPDAVLCSIVSLLHTKEAARTQVISRRWRPLWRTGPLNLVADYDLKSKDHTFDDLISKIISVHPGPARRFSLCLYFSDCHDKIKGWLSSQALDKLEELELIPDYWFRVSDKFYRLPSSVYRFAPTLRVAKFGGCRFTDLIVKLSLKFPCLKQLTLDRVTISEDALQSMLSGCFALESLELKKNCGFGRVCISSQTLKSIGFCADWTKESAPFQELVIEDAPCLERLLALDPQAGPRTIRVISAPKLNVLGVLSQSIEELQFGTTVFQRMIAVGLTTKMHNVRVLVLHYASPLETVVNFLKCFPSLERLYVFFPSGIGGIYNTPKYYDPQEPIECLELHLKEVLLKNYDGTSSLCIDLAKFFVLNAKVLKEMKITLPYHRQYKWFANQHWLLRTKDRASRDARIELKCGINVYFKDNKNTHDLSMADPFDMPYYSGCKKCSGSPF